VQVDLYWLFVLGVITAFLVGAAVGMAMTEYARWRLEMGAAQQGFDQQLKEAARKAGQHTPPVIKAGMKASVDIRKQSNAGRIEHRTLMELLNGFDVLLNYWRERESGK